MNFDYIFLNFFKSFLKLFQSFFYLKLKLIYFITYRNIIKIAILLNCFILNNIIFIIKLNNQIILDNISIKINKFKISNLFSLIKNLKFILIIIKT